jgi:hypothetical protein
MSQRELIVINIMETLRDQTEIVINKLTRDPGIQLADLANTAFPVVLVQSGNETRTSISQGGAGALREAKMEVNLTMWTNSINAIDTLHNDLMESIEAILEADATRGSNALDTQLVTILTNNGDAAPYESFTMVFEIPYLYTKGQP